MKKIIITLFCFWINIVGFSQIVQDTTVKLNLLKAPSSPGSNLLGFANSDIDKPTDLSAFMASLQSSTGAFAQLPSNYAFEIVPYWLFKTKTDFTTKGLNSESLSDIFKQTFALSFAIRNPDSTNTDYKINNTYGAFGFKFSVVRGKYDKKTDNALNSIRSLQNKINKGIRDDLNTLLKSDSTYKILSKLRRKILSEKFGADEELALKDSTYEAINNAINQLQAKILEKPNSVYDKIKEIAAPLILNRIGWSCDIAGGISGEFINKRFDNSRVFNAGVWTTFGHTGIKGGSILFLVRYLYNPNKIFALSDAVNKKVSDISTLDFGGRYIYSNSDSKFTCSAEAIYRSALSSSTISPSWRLIFNADYALWQNQKLTFSFGRNFDGVVSKDGNLVAALGFLIGLGNNR